MNKRLLLTKHQNYGLANPSFIKNKYSAVQTDQFFKSSTKTTVNFHFLTETSLQVPNCVIKAKTVRNRIFVGDEIDDCRDLSGLYYLLAFQKGYLVNWEIERQVWDHIFGKERLNVNFDECGIVVTEPYLNFQSIREGLTEVLFEDYQFQYSFLCTPAFLSQYKYLRDPDIGSRPRPCCLIIDCGYSFTHLVPYYNGESVKNAIRRIDVGGKVMTNHLKEVISYRQLMVMDETHVVNQIKEDTCYVSMDFWKDMEAAKKKGLQNEITQDYVLPDYTHIKRGYVRCAETAVQSSSGTEQIIRMNNERFAIPEILFHPSDIGIQEMGIAEAVVHVISKTPEEMHPHLYSNIVLTGGNCLLPNFRDRLSKDVRSMAPDEFSVDVHCPSNPMTYAWQGGRLASLSQDFTKMIVTKEQYEEHGVNFCLESFG